MTTLSEKYRDSILTINISFIDTCLREVLPASNGQVLTTNHMGYPKWSTPVHRKKYITTVELIHKKFPVVNMTSGNRLVPKIRYLISEADEKTKFFMAFAMAAILDEFSSERRDWEKYSSESMRSSILHFEIFDEQDNLLFSPLDLLHPTSLNYESSKYGFLDKRYGVRYEFEDEYSKFVLLRNQVDYSTVENYITSTLNIAVARLTKNNDIDTETVRSIYAGLPDNIAFNKSIYVSCRWEHTLFPFSIALN